MDIKLNFINQSSDFNDEVVICQKNVAFNFDELIVAWKVISYCGQGDNHPFAFPLTMQVNASDSYGNFTPQLNAQNGQMFKVQLTQSGDQLLPAGSATSPTEVQVLNNLVYGAINANIYKGNRLLATQTAIVPQKMGRFEFKPTIWIGVADQVVQGEIMNSAIMAGINTEISLLGIASADIVMTGSKGHYNFVLQNVVMA